MKTKRTHYRNGDTITLNGCDGCSPCRVNGTLIHEQGCPDAWRDYGKTCFQCGCEFFPSERYEAVCQDCQSEE